MSPHSGQKGPGEWQQHEDSPTASFQLHPGIPVLLLRRDPPLRDSTPSIGSMMCPRRPLPERELYSGPGCLPGLRTRPTSRLPAVAPGFLLATAPHAPARASRPIGANRCSARNIASVGWVTEAWSKVCLGSLSGQEKTRMTQRSDRTPMAPDGKMTAGGGQVLNLL